MDTGQRVIAIIAHQAMTDAADVRPDMAPADLGIDSVGLVESIFAIEEAFDVSVPFNANDPGAGGFDVSSVATIVRAVEALVAAKAPAAAGPSDGASPGA